MNRLSAATAALFASMVLAACGGGGGSSAGTPSTPTTPVQQAAYLAPVTTVATPTYAADTATNVSLSTFNGMNALRLAIGSGEFTQNTLLDTAAKNHWSYLNQNGIASGHGETVGNPGFTGTTPSARMSAAGFAQAGYSSEVYAVPLASALTAANCLAWEDTVYHLGIFFAPALEVGLNAETFTGQNSSIAGCVLDAATPQSSNTQGQLPVDGTILVYPYAGQTGVKTSFIPAGEAPNPAPDLSLAGHPIGLSFATQNHATPVIVLNGLSVTPQGGAAIATRILVNPANTTGSGVAVTNDPNATEYLPGSVFVLPVSVLTANTTYTVAVSATVDGKAMSKSWSFTTSN